MKKSRIDCTRRRSEGRGTRWRGLEGSASRVPK